MCDLSASEVCSPRSPLDIQSTFRDFFLKLPGYSPALVICLICMLSALEPLALELCTYISGKSLVPVLQLIAI